ncbi:Dipeptide transport system permease protein DppB [Baekduia alba]|uniref:ABC transporter permease n=1 Tax=Baekduia alba TaxID=2997333 RepID=UPI0023427E67|nr:ABC transporter permease [Baekduia alba]WCB93985.1 Dipeptide transport system permease protein DppB [Baekduia alba]
MRRLAVRLGGIVVVVVLATACAWILFHLLRPELFRGRGDLGSLPHYLNRAFLHFDFGRSEQGSQRPVADLIREGLPADVALLSGGLAFGLLLGIGGAIACARRPRGWASRAAQVLAMVGLCAPVYVVGLMSLLFFGADIGVVPFDIGIPLRYVEFADSPSGWLGALIVPWIVLGLPLAGMCLRVMLGQMVEGGDEEYVRSARAKGLGEWTVLSRHVAPAALAPTAMLASASMPLLLTNVVLVEQVFSIPGVFRDLTRSIGTANTPLILGMTAVGALLIAVTTFLFDVLLVWLDPRVRAGEVAPASR